MAGLPRRPAHGFKTGTQLPRASEFFQDQGSFQPAANLFHLSGLFRVVLLSAQCIIEYTHHVDHIFMNMFFCGRAPVKHVQQLEFKIETITSDDNIIGMQVTMVLTQLMDTLDTRCHASGTKSRGAAG